MRKSHLGLVVCALLLGGCTGPGTEAAAPASSSVGVSPTRAAVARVAGPDGGLGDLRTVAMCGLLDPAAVAAVTTEPEPVFQSFDYCGFYAKVDGHRVKISADLWSSGVLDGPPVLMRVDWLPDPLRVITHQSDESSCVTGIVSGDASMVLTYIVRMPEHAEGAGPAIPPEKFCAIADAVLEAGAAVIAEDRVDHVTFADRSLGKINACSLLTSAQVSEVLGSGVSAREWPTGHTCDFGPVSVEADLTVWPVSAGYQAETIAGRPTLVGTSRDASTALCEVLTAHIDGPPGTREAMFIVVEVDLARPDPCVAARALAAVVWPRLPPL